ncbi:IPTL-CTERM sorting domain-containing protein [Brevundimonas sp. TWP2-3-4b1]
MATISRVVAVPTLSEWALILMSAALAGGAALTVHRRRQFG